VAAFGGLNYIIDGNCQVVKVIQLNNIFIIAQEGQGDYVENASALILIFAKY